MVRFDGLSGPIRDAYPDGALGAAEAVTSLGEFPLVVVVPAVVYLLADRKRTALVFAYLFGTYGVTLMLKSFFGLPQSPEMFTVIELIPEDDMRGFPSGGPRRRRRPSTSGSSTSTAAIASRSSRRAPPS